MSRITIVVNVLGADPTLVDPHDVAQELIDTANEHLGRPSPEEAIFVSAEWVD